MIKKKPNITHYIFVIIIYNFTLSLIVYGTLYVSEAMDFNYSSWNFVEYWVFFSVLIFITGFFMFLIPSFVEFLEELSQRIVVSVQIKYTANIEKLERKLNELKRDN